MQTATPQFSPCTYHAFALAEESSSMHGRHLNMFTPSAARDTRGNKDSSNGNTKTPSPPNHLHPLHNKVSQLLESLSVEEEEGDRMG